MCMHVLVSNSIFRILLLTHRTYTLSSRFNCLAADSPFRMLSIVAFFKRIYIYILMPHKFVVVVVGGLVLDDSVIHFSSASSQLTYQAVVQCTWINRSIFLFRTRTAFDSFELSKRHILYAYETPPH